MVVLVLVVVAEREKHATPARASAPPCAGGRKGVASPCLRSRTTVS